MSKIRILLAVIAVMVATAPVLACGPADVCGDVTASLTGSVIIGSFAPGLARVELGWWTDQERPGSLSAYRVSRCAAPTDCTPLALVLPSGSCGSLQQYGFVDQPPAPVDAWFYRVELMTHRNGITCPVDVTPE